MAKVLGIGGVFFRSKDPVAMAQWYETHLGISPAPTSMDTPPWLSEGGVTVFAPFAEDSDYFPADHRVMLNFRVDDLEALLAQLEAAGIAHSHRQEIPGLGQFARIADPEGTPIELWQPAAQP